MAGSTPVGATREEGTAAGTPGKSPAAGVKPGGRRDPPPRTGTKRRQPKPARVRPTDQQLEDGLRKALKLCSVPMRFRCDYCATHMATQAAVTARRMIEDSDLREIAERVYVWCEQYAGAGHLAVFLGVPVIHHLAPEFVYRPVAPLMGMPPRPPRGTHVHHMPPAAAPVDTRPNGGSAPAPLDPTGDGAPPTTPFGGMDLETLMATAEALGIKFDGLDLAAAAAGLTADPGDTVEASDAGTESTEAAPRPGPTVPATADPDGPDPFAAAAEAAAEVADALPDAE